MPMPPLKALAGKASGLGGSVWPKMRDAVQNAAPSTLTAGAALGGAAAVAAGEESPKFQATVSPDTGEPVIIVMEGDTPRVLRRDNASMPMEQFDALYAYLQQTAAGDEAALMGQSGAVSPEQAALQQAELEKGALSGRDAAAGALGAVGLGAAAMGPLGRGLRRGAQAFGRGTGEALRGSPFSPFKGKTGFDPGNFGGGRWG